MHGHSCGPAHAPTDLPTHRAGVSSSSGSSHWNNTVNTYCWYYPTGCSLPAAPLLPPCYTSVSAAPHTRSASTVAANSTPQTASTQVAVPLLPTAGTTSPAPPPTSTPTPPPGHLAVPHPNPKPSWPSWMAISSRSLSCSLDSYSGRSSWLKQVWALGRRSPAP